MFEVDSNFHVPETFCYEFSEMRFISLKDIHKYKLAFGVKKEIKHFKQKFFNILEENQFSTVSDDKLFALSDSLISQNMEAYKELAK